MLILIVLFLSYFWYFLCYIENMFLSDISTEIDSVLLFSPARVCTKLCHFQSTILREYTLLFCITMLISVSLSAHSFQRGRGGAPLSQFFLCCIRRRNGVPSTQKWRHDELGVGMMKAGQEVAEQHNVSVETRCLVGFLLFMLFTLQIFFCSLSLSQFLIFCCSSPPPTPPQSTLGSGT